MEPEIIFGESLRGSDSKKTRREVYETVEHINNVHPTKITKVVVYIDGKGRYVTELWSGKYYSKQSVPAGGDVSAERGILYAHLRVSAKANAITWPSNSRAHIGKEVPTLNMTTKLESYIMYLENLAKSGAGKWLDHSKATPKLSMAAETEQSQLLRWQDVTSRYASSVAQDSTGGNK